MAFVDDIPARLRSAEIPQETAEKWQCLVSSLGRLDSALVAYSGGVDSSLLATAAFVALGDRMAAITVHSALTQPAQMDTAKQVSQSVGFRHEVLSLDFSDIPEMAENPPERCYYCKMRILEMIWDYARSNHFLVVVEGQHAEDEDDYRPGRKAVRQTGTQSPLAANRLTKSDIRTIARTIGLPNWDTPASPCLATRIPYGVPVTDVKLIQVSQAESFLQEMGFLTVRVRAFPEMACIEVEPDIRVMTRILAAKDQIIPYFKQIGFHRVTLDLAGYRMGSMNEELDQ